MFIIKIHTIETKLHENTENEKTIDEIYEQKINELKQNVIFKKKIISGLCSVSSIVIIVIASSLIKSKISFPHMQLVLCGILFISGVLLIIGALFNGIYNNQINNINYLEQETNRKKEETNTKDGQIIFVNNYNNAKDPEILITFGDFSEKIYDSLEPLV